MTFITKKHLPRRVFLRGIGVTLSLPLLDAMLPAQTPLSKALAAPKTRFGAIYVPHGAYMARWTPTKEGTGFEFPEMGMCLTHQAATCSFGFSLDPRVWRTMAS